MLRRRAFLRGGLAAAATALAAPHAAFAAPRSPADEPIRPKTTAAVLMYHVFGHGGGPQEVSGRELETQLDLVEELGFEIVSVSDLVAHLGGEKTLGPKVVAITIDDGHKSIRDTAFAIFERRKTPVTLALNTAVLEAGHTKCVSWSDVTRMLDSGLVEVGSHSHVHGFMGRMTDSAVRRELELSRTLITKRLGVEPRTFFYPFGSRVAKTEALTENAGYRAAFDASGLSPITTDSPRYRLPRLGLGSHVTAGALRSLLHRDGERYVA